MNARTALKSHPLSFRLCRRLAPLLFGVLLAAPLSLTAQVAPPTFSMSLSPETLGVGSCTELTFTIQNGAQTPVSELAFTLDLPAGVTLARPANPLNDCGGTLTAVDGGSTISLSDGLVAANSTCTIRVGLTISAPGPFDLTTGDLTYVGGGNAGTASASLGAPASGPVLGFTKSFLPTLVPLGGTSTLTYSIHNQSTVAATMISFTDNLPAGISIANPPNVTSTCAGGEITAVAGTQVISYGQIISNPNLPAGETCTISVDVVGVDPGENVSISGPITASSVGAAPVSSGRACAVLEVIPSDQIADLTFTKSFLDNPIDPGGTSTLEFTITNNSLTESAFDISFTDDLNDTLPGLLVSDVPTEGGLILQSGFDTTGSPNVIGGTWDYLDRIENELGANQSYPDDADGDEWNSPDFDVATSEIGPWSSGADPLQAGVIDAFPPGTPAVLFGVDAAPDGTSNIITTYLFRHEFNLTADQLTIDDWILEYLFDDGAIVYVNGVEVFRTPNMPAGPVNTNTLSALGVENAFDSSPVDLSSLLELGQNTLAVELHQTTLESSDAGFSLQMRPASESSTGGFSYADDTFNGTTNEDFAAGSLDPTGGFGGGGALSLVVGGQTGFFGFGIEPVSGAWSRTFDLDAAVTTTVSFRYRMIFDESYDDTDISQVIFELDGVRYGTAPDGSLVQFTGGAGADQDTGWQTFSREIALGPGTHTIVLGAFNDESNATTELTQVWFDDVQIGTPETPARVCGPGSALTGTDVLTLTGGSLGPGESCTFGVEVQVPLDTPTGEYLNVTSRLSTSIGGDNPKVAFPASDTLRVEPIPPAFAKTFSPNSIAEGGISTLTFTIDNSASLLDAENIDFTDTLPAGVVIADPTNASATCTGGTLSAVAGTSEITYSGGSVNAGSICTVTVNVTAQAPNDYLNTSGDLTSSLGNSGPASATLTVNPPPLFSKSFAPSSLNAGQVATLTFLIDNSASTIDATAISFTDNLPAGLVLANPVNFTTNCIGGVVNASPGTGLVSYNGGIVPAGSTCTLSVEVTSLEGGSYANTTGDLTSSLGNSGTASATLDVEAIVSVTLSKTESADPVIAGSGVGNLIYTVTAVNAGPSTATGVTVIEALTLPAGVSLVSTTPSAGTTYSDPTWTIGTLAGGSSATLTVVLTVDASAQPGTDIIADTATLSAVNETNNIEVGGSASESTSIITRADLQITNTESIDPVIAGSGAGNLSYLVTVTNHGPSNATGVTVMDTLTLPAGVTIDSVTPSGTTSFADPTWTVGDLAPGATEILTIVLTAGPSAPAGTGLIVNDASVASLDQTDVNPQTNAVSEGTSVVREINLTATIIESRDPVLAGFDLPHNLRHTVAVTNNGPSDASDIEFDVSNVLPPGVVLNSVIVPAGVTVVADTMTISQLASGASTSAAFQFDVPATVPGGVDVISTSAVFRSANEPLTNDNDVAASEATSVVSPLSMAISAGEIALDLQSALFKQTITITNNNPVAVPAFRLLVDGLPADVTVHNAQGESGGRSYLLYNQALAPGASVDLVVEYNQEDVSGGFDPTFEIELVDAVEEVAATEGAELQRIEKLPSGDILLEFSSTIGTTYTIQYTEDGTNWFKVVPDVIAGADRTQWIDNGPPKTPSHPSTVDSRLYRVLEQERGDN